MPNIKVMHFGLGPIGAAIVKQVAETHGGEVVAEPAEGGGTRMSLRLNGRAVS